MSLQKEGASLSGKIPPEDFTLLLAEYNALRAEILQRMGMQFQVFSLAITVHGALLAFGFQSHNAGLILLYPVLATFFAIMWVINARRTRRIGLYIKTRIEDRVTEYQMGWEHEYARGYRQGIGLNYWAARGIFIGTSLLAIFVGVYIAQFNLLIFLFLGIALASTVITIILLRLQHESPMRSLGDVKNMAFGGGLKMTDRDLAQASIAHLPELVSALPPAERTLVTRLFQVVTTQGEMVPPEAMQPWMEQTFGSLPAALQQRIVRVTNRWTFEGATFNPLRALRPGTGASQKALAVPAEVSKRIEEQREKDSFCDPYQQTPADTFGREVGKHLLTASNVAKFDGWHGLLLFKEHNPLAIDEALVQGVLEVAHRWSQRAQAADPAARHFFLSWNCLWRAGASRVHGHAHLTLSQEMAHAKVELLREVAARYRLETGGDYFTDLVAVHEALGVVVRNGPVIRLVSLTPVRAREVVLLLLPADSAGASWEERLKMLGGPLAETLRVARERLGVLAFNLAIFGPPLQEGAGSDQSWQDFPFVARFVDRGDPLSPTSDIGAMELFGSSVIASDPFDVVRALISG